VQIRIREYIAAKHLSVGDRLPTETEFCRFYNVSRSTVRQALRQVEADGLILRTRGKGTFLRDPRQPPPKAGNETANGLRIPRSHKHATIGVVFSYASEVDIMQTAILRGIEHAVKAHGYNVLAGRADDRDEAGEMRAMADLCNVGVSGLIVLPISNCTSTAGVRMLLERKVAVVLVDRYLSDLDTSYVVSDNQAGMYSVTQHLILLGYTAFEFVVGLAGGSAAQQVAATSVRDRYEGYCQALRDYDMAGAIRGPVAVDTADRGAVRALLTRANGSPARLSAGPSAGSPAGRPAIVAVHDYVALDFMNTAAKIGLKAPDDYAITGFDDLPIASHLSVPLTTVVQPRYDIGFRAGHLLMDKLVGNPVRNDKLSLLVSLVVRESCGAHQIARRRRASPDAGSDTNT
jgi:DNA-binding LacI/PurR family transcriptional regulator